jgi:hypothetical protein
MRFHNIWLCPVVGSKPEDLGLLSAEHVIDYNQSDFKTTFDKLLDQAPFVIIVCGNPTGTIRPLSSYCAKIIKANYVYIAKKLKETGKKAYAFGLNAMSALEQRSATISAFIGLPHPQHPMTSPKEPMLFEIEPVERNKIWFYCRKGDGVRVKQLVDACYKAFNEKVKKMRAKNN